MAKELTDAGIRRLKPPKKDRRDHFDRPFPGLQGGLALRISANGTRCFVLFYRIHDRDRDKVVQRRDTLGTYTADADVADGENLLTLAQARAIAQERLSLVAARKDPRDRDREEDARQAEAKALTYAAAVDEFIKRYAIAKKDNRRHQDQRKLLLNANPNWHDRPVSEITKGQIIDRLDFILDGGKDTDGTVRKPRPYLANRTYSALGTFYRWLYNRDRIPENPMDRVERPFANEKPRDRVWTADELKVIWNKAGELEDDIRDYVRVLILLGQRRNEVAGMRWSEIDLEKATWTLPGERHKRKRKHVFPLSTAAVDILRGRPRVKNNDYVFPGRGRRNGGAVPMSVGSKIKTRIQNVSGVKDFTYHDARRTFRTGLDELRVAPHIKDECLHHARRGVGDTHYSQHQYVEEQREAFQAWENHIRALAEDASANVVRLRG